MSVLVFTLCCTHFPSSVVQDPKFTLLESYSQLNKNKNKNATSQQTLLIKKNNSIKKMGLNYNEKLTKNWNPKKRKEKTLVLFIS